MRLALTLTGLFVAYIVGLYFLLFTQTASILIPTTNITMVPPPGYSASLRFPGMENPLTDGSFTVNRFPKQALGSLGAMFASRARAEPTLNNRGITVEGVEEIKWQGEDLLLFRGTQKNEAGVLYEKWIAVYTAERPIMVAFQEPRPGKLVKEQIIAAYQSMRIEGTEIADER